MTDQQRTREGILPMRIGERTYMVQVKESTLEKLKVFEDESDEWDGIINDVLRIIQKNAPVGTESPWLGSKNAPVVIHEFSDFECYYCMEALPTVKKILEVYKDKVKVVFRNYPRTLKHPNALNAHIAAMCALNQGKFWEFHDELLGNYENLMPEVINKIASKLGLDMDAFNSCLTRKEHILRIFLDKQEGYEMGVRRVPTFFLNGVKVEGSRSFSEFAALIDKAIKGHK